MTIHDAALRDPQRMRHADRELLSLALIEARNRLLAQLALFDGVTSGPPAPAWLAGHAGWFQDWWIGRHLQRGRVARATRQATRLASIEPRADGWWRDRDDACAMEADAVRTYLAATLETSLDLLERAGDDDLSLLPFRLALLHEDRLCETLQALAVSTELPAGRRPPLDAELARRGRRDALWFAAAAWRIGSEAGGMVPDNECPAHELKLPEFEIDAQPVSWAQFAEFAHDGGYDDPRWWAAEGWAWLQATGRRAPLGVEQWTNGVAARRGGRLQRMSGVQAAVHLSWYEADAWCRWAGRRLPVSPEWEAAARSGAGRGWSHGEVFEWTASGARGYDGHADGPARLDAVPAPGTQRELRGGSQATHPRRLHVQARRFADPRRDDGFFGFRSCAA